MYHLVYITSLTHWLCVYQENSRYIEPMFDYCWDSVYDPGPAFTQHVLNVSCSLGSDTGRIESQFISNYTMLVYLGYQANRSKFFGDYLKLACTSIEEMEYTRWQSHFSDKKDRVYMHPMLF